MNKEWERWYSEQMKKLHAECKKGVVMSVRVISRDDFGELLADAEDGDEESRNCMDALADWIEMVEKSGALAGCGCCDNPVPLDDIGMVAFFQPLEPLIDCPQGMSCAVCSDCTAKSEDQIIAELTKMVEQQFNARAEKVSLQ